jgi:hypothetical protein
MFERICFFIHEWSDIYMLLVPVAGVEIAKGARYNHKEI